MLQTTLRFALLLLLMAHGLKRAAAVALTRPLEVATWNVAGANNNPFEYWVRGGGEADGMREYQMLMEGVERHIAEGGGPLLGSIFTEEMSEQLAEDMRAISKPGTNWDPAFVDSVMDVWRSSLQQRKAVDFLLSADVGVKRLVSMPDRVTNRVEETTDEGTVTHCRPAVVSCYSSRPMGTVQQWWPLWREFMFKTTYRSGKGKIGTVADGLIPLSRKKYPAVTEEEERVSLPLQVLHIALFDAVTVHMMSSIAPGTWEESKLALVRGLGSGKQQRTLDILADSYADSDIIFLQETSVSLANAVAAHPRLSKTHAALQLTEPDPRRPQNSLILVSKEVFAGGGEDVTAQVVDGADTKLSLARGDLCAVTATPHGGSALLLVSLHADTNGLGTLPAVRAAVRYARAHGLVPLFGTDANSHWDGKVGERLSVAEFDSEVQAMGLTTTWKQEGCGGAGRLTTFNARTPVQPQLNKAVRSADVDAAAAWAVQHAEVGSVEAGSARPVQKMIDLHPKDAIVYSAEHFFVAGATLRDSTGGRVYRPEALPSPQFPSDHVIVSATLRSAQLSSEL